MTTQHKPSSGRVGMSVGLFINHFGVRSVPPCSDCDDGICTMNCGPKMQPRNLTFELTEAMREAVCDGEGVLTEKIVARHLSKAGLYICATTGQEPFCPRCGKKNIAGVSCSVGGCPIGGDA